MESLLLVIFKSIRDVAEFAFAQEMFQKYRNNRMARAWSMCLGAIWDASLVNEAMKYLEDPFKQDMELWKKLETGLLPKYTIQLLKYFARMMHLACFA